MIKCILSFILIFSVGCVSPFENNTNDIFLAYTIRQNLIKEQQNQNLEKEKAVKMFQIEAVQNGFGIWSVDSCGNVTFKWAMWKVKK